jgi:hypothetical protein
MSNRHAYFYCVDVEQVLKNKYPCIRIWAYFIVQINHTQDTIILTVEKTSLLSSIIFWFNKTLKKIWALIILIMTVFRLWHIKWRVWRMLGNWFELRPLRTIHIQGILGICMNFQEFLGTSGFSGSRQIKYQPHVRRIIILKNFVQLCVKRALQ